MLVEQYAALFQRVAMIMGLSGVKWGQRPEADGFKYTILWIPIVDELASRNVTARFLNIYLRPLDCVMNGIKELMKFVNILEEMSPF